MLPALTAMRPYETIDGGTVDKGTAVIEWGMVDLQLRPEQTSMIFPEVLARLGVLRQFELGVSGAYRAIGSGGAAPWAGNFAVGDFGLYGKWAVVPGVLHNASWIRPSVSVSGGAQFYTAESLWSLQSRLAGTFVIGPVMTHVNIGFHYENHARVTVGAVVNVPLWFGLTPGVEMSGEVRYGAHPSAAGILLGLSQALPRVPLILDAGVRRALTSGTPDWSVLFGISMKMRMWRPN